MALAEEGFKRGLFGDVFGARVDVPGGGVLLSSFFSMRQNGFNK
jgi:hypothetical protein